VNLSARHLRVRAIEVIGLEIGDDEPVVASDEERVVRPARFGQRLEHRGPHPIVRSEVVVDAIALQLHREAHALRSHALTFASESVPYRSRSISSSDLPRVLGVQIAPTSSATASKPIMMRPTFATPAEVSSTGKK